METTPGDGRRFLAQTRGSLLSRRGNAGRSFSDQQFPALQVIARLEWTTCDLANQQTAFDGLRRAPRLRFSLIFGSETRVRTGAAVGALGYWDIRYTDWKVSRARGEVQERQSVVQAAVIDFDLRRAMTVRTTD